VAVQYDTHEHLFNQVRVLNKQKLRSMVGIFPPQVYPVSFVVVPSIGMPLFKIARMSVAGYYRKREKQPVFVPLVEAAYGEEEKESGVLLTNHPDSDPVWSAEVRDEWSAVVSAINTLTEEQRQVLIGRLILGYDVATVAQMIGKNANAVKALQFRALQSLQRLLGKHYLLERAFHSHAGRKEEIP
jgi:RNA polymerase sigma-70 factor, ECF subfamily